MPEPQRSELGGIEETKSWVRLVSSPENDVIKEFQYFYPTWAHPADRAIASARCSVPIKSSAPRREDNRQAVMRTSYASPAL